MSEFRIDFPTLGILVTRGSRLTCWCHRPLLAGNLAEMADWQFWCHANRYRVREDAKFVPPELVGPDNPPVLNQAFFFISARRLWGRKDG